MDILAFIARIRLEIEAFTGSPDRRQYVLDRVATYFDWLATKVEIPGPDAWIRYMLLWLVGELYDVIAKALAGAPARVGGPSTLWDDAPGPPIYANSSILEPAEPVASEPTEPGDASG